MALKGQVVDIVQIRVSMTEVRTGALDIKHRKTREKSDPDRL